MDFSEYDVSSIENKTIKQPLDHFDQNEKRTLKARYFQNLEYWKPNGPILVFIGGEGALDPAWIINHPDLLITQIAMETNGAMFSLEHRYYGKSVPDTPKDDKIQYYKYLSSQQALEDLANLIKTLKQDPKYKTSPVVVIGGSYAGNLAAWVRELYPQLVDAAIAISAPVLAQKDFHEYLDVVRYTFGKYGPKNCLSQIENTFKIYEALLKTPSGRETLRRILHLDIRTDLAVLENQQSLFADLYGYLKFAAQANFSPFTVKEACNKYDSSSNILNLKFDRLTSNIRSGDTLESDERDEQSWTYQFCNEFGYLQTTSSEKQPFVHWNPLEFWLKFCKGFVQGDIEKTIDEGVAKSNAMYGGRTPNVTKVVFTHGDMDPWKALGVQGDLAPDAPMIMVYGTSHCGMLYFIEGEPNEMTEKRKYVKDLIKKWISKS